MVSRASVGIDGERAGHWGFLGVPPQLYVTFIKDNETNEEPVSKLLLSLPSKSKKIFDFNNFENILTKILESKKLEEWRLLRCYVVRLL
jgi:hypothetical protein